jgi:hypothetical protein
MLPRSIAAFLLVISLAFTVPLTVEAWLRGAHVTFDQMQRHVLAVDQYGEHDHGAGNAHRYDGGTRRAQLDAVSDAVTLSVTTPSTSGFFLFGLWQAIAAVVLALWLPRVGWLQRRPAAPDPASHVPDHPAPPPRSRRLALA